MKLYPPTGGDPVDVSNEQAKALTASGWSSKPPKTTAAPKAAASKED